MSSFRRSGVQRQVLKLYKDIVREIQRKPAKTQPELLVFARHQFKSRSSIPRMEMRVIEHWMQYGKRQLKSLKATDDITVTFFKPDRPNVTQGTATNTATAAGEKKVGV
jgi:succinate dehydrogenase assembly factor 1